MTPRGSSCRQVDEWTQTTALRRYRKRGMRRTPPSLSGPAVSPRLAFQAPSLSADMEHIYARERRQGEVDARMLPYSGRIVVPRRPERGRGLSDSSKVGAGSSPTPRACDAAVCWRGEARDTPRRSWAAVCFSRQGSLVLQKKLAGRRRAGYRSISRERLS